MNAPHEPVADQNAATDPRELRRAVLSVLVYGDIFDHALTVEEIVRYAPDHQVDMNAVQRLLDADEPSCPWERTHEFVHLRGRSGLVVTRRRRCAASRAIWPQAIRYGRLLGRLPTVRMVAITGALAMDAAEPGDDIDLLLVARTGSVWTCRALAVALARSAATWGVRLCPNFVLGEDALCLRSHSLHAARDLMQMVPVCGLSTYEEMRRANPWADRLLPNAEGPPRQCGDLGERRTFLGPAPPGRLARRLERFLRARQQARLQRKIETGHLTSGESSFSPSVYRGHFDGHGDRISSRYRERLEEVTEMDSRGWPRE